MPDQEIRAGAPRVTYWEGEVQVRGRKNGVPISGQGFVELTGYAGGLGGRFWKRRKGEEAKRRKGREVLGCGERGY